MNTELYQKYYNKIRQTEVAERNLYIGKTDEHTFDLSPFLADRQEDFYAFLNGKSENFLYEINGRDKEKLKKLQEKSNAFVREKGENDLFIGFPFWYGKGDRAFRAPVLFQAIKIIFLAENRVKLVKTEEKNRINFSLFIHYCLSCDIDCPFLEEGFFSSSLPYGTEEDYLRKRGIDSQTERGFVSFSENAEKSSPTLTEEAVLGHFTPDDDFARDYRFLLKKPSPSSALSALTDGEKRPFFSPVRSAIYPVLPTDPSQEEALRLANKGRNLLLFGPPGTGKSQTVVNLVSHFLYQRKKILVVSQNKYALQVLFSKLSPLSDAVLPISTSASGKSDLFRRAVLCHKKALSENKDRQREGIKETDKQIQALFRSFSDVEKYYLSKSETGLCVREMMQNSANMEEDEHKKEIYDRLRQNRILDIPYGELKEIREQIENNEWLSTYCAFRTFKKKYRFLDFCKHNVDSVTVRRVVKNLRTLQTNVPEPPDTQRYPLAPLIPFDAENNPSSLRFLLPVVRNRERLAGKTPPNRKEILSALAETRDVVRAYESRFTFLKEILNREGYLYFLSHVQESLEKLPRALKVYEAFQVNYDAVRVLEEKTLRVLDICYRYRESTQKNPNEILRELLACKLYRELKENAGDISFSDRRFFDAKREKYHSLQEKRRTLVARAVLHGVRKSYADYFEKRKHADYLFALQNGSSSTSLRKFFDENKNFISRLFPCVLTDTETVCNVFPMQKELFDVVIFDEAGQIPVETAIPCLYRAKRVVVAGDDKQMPPSDLFRCKVRDETGLANLRSVYELALSRLQPVPLRYHYRSKSNDLVAFSNHYFYNDDLTVAPDSNLSPLPCIERIKVDGVRENKHNDKEAKAIVELLKKIFSDSPQKSVGVVLFNVEQKIHLEKCIEKECRSNPVFSTHLRERPDFFVRNIDNIQGDERDVIVIGTGYAKEKGEESVRLLFGSLSQEGGERRLNVAVTRAKEKIYLVTSFEPEELSDVENCKFLGPKLFREYLYYARDIANGKAKPNGHFSEASALQEIKTFLERKGYRCKSFSSPAFSLPLAVTNREGNKFLLGVDLVEGKNLSAREDIFRTDFLEKKGWKIMHIGVSDLWNGKEKLLCDIMRAVKEEEKSL